MTLADEIENSSLRIIGAEERFLSDEEKAYVVGLIRSPGPSPLDGVEWKIARTYAHLHLNGRYTGISVSLRHSWAAEDPELLRELKLPPLRGAEPPALTSPGQQAKTFNTLDAGFSLIDDGRICRDDDPDCRHPLCDCARCINEQRAGKT